MKLDPRLVATPARVLEGPTRIKYANNLPLRGPSWNLASAKLLTTREIPAWGFVYEGRRQDIPERVSRFVQNSRGLGVRFPQSPPRGFPIFFNPGNVENVFSQAKVQKLKLLFFVLPNDSSDTYSNIKYLGDVQYGIHTICVVREKFMKPRGQEQYDANVSLKFNLKTGGVNHSVEEKKLEYISGGETMIIGIDVTHPSPGSASFAPSIAGVVANVDSEFGQWPGVVSLQSQGGQEMVTNLDSMLVSRLNLWKTKNNGRLPQKVLVYRDGVSEGQYQLILDQELPLLREACKKTYPPGRQPKITIIIVGKRHNTRFFPTQEPQDTRGFNGNIPVGTVVDRGITEARSWDFFLQSHRAIQGTARPAYYFVVHNEIFPSSNTPVDTIQNVTNNLCYTFGRATLPVSVAPPTYYADLICERARCYLATYYNQAISDNASTTTSGSQQQLNEADAQRMRERLRVHDNLKDTMFYI